jgi:hypothetical protein
MNVTNFPRISKLVCWVSAPRRGLLCLMFKTHGKFVSRGFDAISELRYLTGKRIGLDLEPNRGHGSPSLHLVKNVLSSIHLSITA